MADWVGHDLERGLGFADQDWDVLEQGEKTFYGWKVSWKNCSIVDFYITMLRIRTFACNR